MVRLPVEYQEVEYLESVGGQYINLPYGFLDTDEVEIVASLKSTGNDKYMVAPSVWNNHTNRFSMAGKYGTAFRVGFGSLGTSATRFSPGIASDALIHKWTYKNRTFTIVDLESVCDVSSATFGEETNYLRLFYGYNASTAGQICSFHQKKANGNELNLIPCYRKSDNEPGMYDTVSGTFYTNSGTGEFLVGGDVTWDTASLLERRRQILLNTPHIESASGSMATFSTDMSAPLTECKVHFAPVQEGTGTPSPENVRPISGWDGVTVWARSKNYLPDYSDTSFWTNGYFDSSGNENTRSDYRRTPNAFFVKAGTYTISSANKTWKGVIAYDASGTKIYFGEWSNNSQSFTIEQDAYIKVYAQASSTNLQLEKGSTATQYEPYQGQSLTIPFPQTIYGGYVDLVKGEVVEEWARVVLDGVNRKLRYNYSSNSGYDLIGSGWVYAVPQGYRTVVYCDKLQQINPNQKVPLSFWPYGQPPGMYMVLSPALKSEHPEIDNTVTTEVVNFCNNWLADNPVTICYELKTPNTYSLTP